MITVLDPSFDDAPSSFALPVRPTTLAGATVGIISNGKVNTRPFFDHLERMLREQWGVAEVIRRTKTNYSAPPKPPHRGGRRLGGDVRRCRRLR
jgi:hypothetical protein